MYTFDKSFRKSPKNYIRQNLLAMLVVAIILIFLRLLHGFVVTAAWVSWLTAGRFKPP